MIARQPVSSFSSLCFYSVLQTSTPAVSGVSLYVTHLMEVMPLFLGQRPGELGAPPAAATNNPPSRCCRLRPGCQAVLRDSGGSPLLLPGVLWVAERVAREPGLVHRVATHPAAWSACSYVTNTALGRSRECLLEGALGSAAARLAGCAGGRASCLPATTSRPQSHRCVCGSESSNVCVWSLVCGRPLGLQGFPARLLSSQVVERGCSLMLKRGYTAGL